MNTLERSVGKQLNSLFRMAVLAGVENSVRLHVNRGDDLNARDGNGMTPLMLAASKNKGSICAFLLSSGADLSMTDSNGRDALAIAHAVGAADAISAMAQFAPLAELLVQEQLGAVSSEKGDKDCSSKPIRQDLIEKSVLDDGEDLADLSDWEPDEDRQAPDADKALVEAAIASYLSISSHVPFDTSEDWSAFDAFLPDMAMPLPKIGEEAAREQIYRILRRALREGSVPERDIHELFETENESGHEFDEALLRIVLADMGAETDERIETSELHDQWSEKSEDDSEVAEARLHFEDLRANRNAPLTQYLREVQKSGKLLTSAEEVELAKSMEDGLAAAVDALASWPAGVAAFLAASERVRSGEVEADLVSELGEDEPAEMLLAQNDDPAEELGEDEVSDIESSAGTSDFLDKVGAVRILARMAGVGGDDEAELRQALRATKPSPTLLNSVADICKAENSGFGVSFGGSLGRYAKAKERLICANLRLVMAFVKKYQAFGLPYEDLIQEGNLGLMKAADRFDWRKGFRFTTYATWWIKQSATRALADKGHTIRTPVHYRDSMLKLEKEVDLIELQLGRITSRQFLADKLSVPRKKVEELTSWTRETVSLDDPDASGLIPTEQLMDRALASDPYMLAERSSLIVAMGRILEEVRPKMAELITMRFGLDGNGTRTLEEIGVHFGITRERVRQMEAATLKYLTHPIRSDKLRTFLDGPASEPRLVKASAILQEQSHIQQKKQRKPREVKKSGFQASENIPHANAADAEIEVIDPALDSRLQNASSILPEPIPVEQEVREQESMLKWDKFQTPEKVNGARATNRAIEMAKAAGARVVDSREDGGAIVVQLISEESQHRVVIRTLLNAGFTLYNGMEFRK